MDGWFAVGQVARNKVAVNNMRPGGGKHRGRSRLAGADAACQSENHAGYSSWAATVSVCSSLSAAGAFASAACSASGGAPLLAASGLASALSLLDAVKSSLPPRMSPSVTLPAVTWISD